MQAPWTMGLIADLHFGLAPDAGRRLESFMEAVAEHHPDCLLQLGDFNYGVDDAHKCLGVWRQFDGPRYHVLGNHDMDKTDKAHIRDAWEMPDDYYSFDHKGWHFVVLDRNHLRIDGTYHDYDTANFYVDGKQRGFADPEQLEWLADDLAKTDRPTVVFSHQGLGMSEAIEPDTAPGMIEQVLAKANQTHPGRVVACLCGHHHIDRYQQRDGIHYLWINSASYYWVGADYGRMAPYTRPLYTFLTFHADGSIEVAGADSDWEKPTPAERGYPGAEQLTPFIKPRKLKA